MGKGGGMGNGCGSVEGEMGRDPGRSLYLGRIFLLTANIFRKRQLMNQSVFPNTLFYNVSIT